MNSADNSINTEGTLNLGGQFVNSWDHTAHEAYNLAMDHAIETVIDEFDNSKSEDLLATLSSRIISKLIKLKSS